MAITRSTEDKELKQARERILLENGYLFSLDKDDTTEWRKPNREGDFVYPAKMKALLHMIGKYHVAAQNSAGTAVTEDVSRDQFLGILNGQPNEHFMHRYFDQHGLPLNIALMTLISGTKLITKSAEGLKKDHPALYDLKVNQIPGYENTQQLAADAYQAVIQEKIFTVDEVALIGRKLRENTDDNHYLYNITQYLNGRQGKKTNTQVELTQFDPETQAMLNRRTPQELQAAFENPIFNTYRKGYERLIAIESDLKRKIVLVLGGGEVTDEQFKAKIDEIKAIQSVVMIGNIRISGFTHTQLASQSCELFANKSGFAKHLALLYQLDRLQLRLPNDHAIAFTDQNGQPFTINIEYPKDYAVIDPKKIVAVDDKPECVENLGRLGVQTVLADTIVGENREQLNQHPIYLDRLYACLTPAQQLECDALTMRNCIDEMAAQIRQIPKEKSSFMGTLFGSSADKKEDAKFQALLSVLDKAKGFLAEPSQVKRNDYQHLAEDLKAHIIDCISDIKGTSRFYPVVLLLRNPEYNFLGDHISQAADILRQQFRDGQNNRVEVFKTAFDQLLRDNPESTSRLIAAVTAKFQNLENEESTKKKDRIPLAAFQEVSNHVKQRAERLPERRL